MTLKKSVLMKQLPVVKMRRVKVLSARGVSVIFLRIYSSVLKLVGIKQDFCHVAPKKKNTNEIFFILFYLKNGDLYSSPPNYSKKILAKKKCTSLSSLFSLSIKPGQLLGFVIVLPPKLGFQFFFFRIMLLFVL